MNKYRILTNLKGAISPNPFKTWSVDFIEDAAIVLSDFGIEWLGRRKDLSTKWSDAQIIDGHQCWVSPGFVDPHTHLLFGGDRSQEFNLRLHGVSYAQIAADGGGIWQTVKATRDLSLQELINIGEERLQKFSKKGVVHLEVKTGYGLSLEAECKLLNAYKCLKERGWSIDVTLMPAHDIPREFSGDPDRYIDIVSNVWQPELVNAYPGLVKFCDIFIEKGVFNTNHGRIVLASGEKLGLVPRIHADEFCSTGGAELAAELHAASADHLMFVSDAGITAMAQANVTPVLLPATTLFLGMKDFAPARKLISAGCKVALASDFNPGSCACIDPLLLLRLGCLQLRMTFEEAFTAMTLHSAISLRRHDLGHLYPGGSSRILLWDIKHPLDLVYWMGENFLPSYMDDRAQS